MSFLNNLFGKDVNINSVKSSIINDMETKWKLHVQSDLKSDSDNVDSFLYAVQAIKFKSSLEDRKNAEKIMNTNMAYGLVPMIQNGQLNIQITNFLEVYIYFYKNDTVGFLANIVDTGKEKMIGTIDTSLKSAQDEYRNFIKEAHVKTFL